MAASNYDAGAATKVLWRLQDIAMGAMADSMTWWTTDRGRRDGRRGGGSVDSAVCDRGREEVCDTLSNWVSNYQWLLVLVLGLPTHPLQLVYSVS